MTEKIKEVINQLNGIQEALDAQAEHIFALSEQLTAMIAEPEPESAPPVLAPVPDAAPPPPPAEAPPPPPPAAAIKTETVIEQTEVGLVQMGDLTIDQYLDGGWKLEQLISMGYVAEVERPLLQEAPVVGVAPPPPPAPEPEPEPEGIQMAPSANGATYEMFIANGWDHARLAASGYLADPNEPDPATVDAPVEEESHAVVGSLTTPAQNDDGKWVDASGALFDPAKHSVSKEMLANEAVPPKVTEKGMFKTRRGKAKTTPKAEAKPKPKAVQAPPPPPPVENPPSLFDAPPPPPALDDVSDKELDALVKGFNTAA